MLLFWQAYAKQKVRIENTYEDEGESDDEKELEATVLAAEEAAAAAEIVTVEIHKKEDEIKKKDEIYKLSQVDRDVSFSVLTGSPHRFGVSNCFLRQNSSKLTTPQLSLQNHVSWSFAMDIAGGMRTTISITL